ncbi:MAG TPA: DUF4097 family beta strand repeat-containing protein [Blastocatellia bacterium]|nr:DUF4097 family beta strand repeat-containing protein [Blastocatellia bacterium]
MYRIKLTTLACAIAALCLAAAARIDARGQALINHRPQAPAQQPFRLERGGKVSVTNPSGDIIITGWDRDTIEVTARGEDSASPASIRVRGDSRSAIISIPAEVRRLGGQIDLDIKVPRYAEIESAESRHGDVSVSDVDGGVFISANNGDVIASRLGSLRVETRNGDVSARSIRNSLNVSSLNGDVISAEIGSSVEVKATSGDISISNAGADVRAYSASGDIHVTCAKSRVDASTASGTITLTGVGGDVEGTTASGSVVFRGPIRKGGRYSLKSLSGEVEMFIQPDPPGFTATLTTYRGEIETEFELKITTPFRGPVNRRVTGVYGDGQARIDLDSFSGTVRIVKANPEMLRGCQ